MWEADQAVDAALHMQEIRGETVSDVVERAKAALEGATAGPWDLVPGAWGNVWRFSDDPGSPPLIVRMGGMTQPDAEFIAQARTLVPELVAEVERLRAREGKVAEASYRTGQLDAEASE